MRDMPRMLEPAVRERAVSGLKAMGFRFVTFDLEGFRSGSLNTAAGIPAASRPPGDPVRDS